MHKAEGGQSWQHVPPKSPGLEPLFTFNFSGWQGSTLYFSQMCFWLATRGPVVATEIPRWSLAGPGSFWRDVLDPGTPGTWLAHSSKVMHFNKALPIPFLKGTDYVLWKWALNSADPLLVGHFRCFLFFSAWTTLVTCWANTTANATARNSCPSSKLNGLSVFPESKHTREFGGFFS